MTCFYSVYGNQKADIAQWQNHHLISQQSTRLGLDEKYVSARRDECLPERIGYGMKAIS